MTDSTPVIISITKETPLTDLGVTLEDRKGKNESTCCSVLFGGLIFSREVNVVVASCVPGGPAATAGLQPGDVVKSINGEAVDSAVGCRTSFQQANHGMVQCQIIKGVFFAPTNGGTSAPEVAVGVKVGPR